MHQFVVAQGQYKNDGCLQLESRGEVYFCFPTEYLPKNKISCVSIDKVINDTAYAYANQKEFLEFLNLRLPYKILTPPSLLVSDKSLLQAERFNWSAYPGYPQYDSIMKALPIKNPAICKLTEFGTSVNGHFLLALKLSDNVEINESEPEVFLTSTMHGDEVTGYMLLLRLAEFLVNEYGKNPEITDLLNNYEVWINPNANPDGTYAISDASVYGATRYNANSVDLNRDFPVLNEPDSSKKEYQPETNAMMRFMEQHNFTLSANYHGGAEVVNYPWDTWEHLHADDNWFVHISREYAESVKQAGGENYFTTITEPGYTNGYQWYSIKGGRQDYATYFNRSREVTIELSNEKMPQPGNQNYYWESNQAAILSFIKQAGKGIHGVILDSDTQKPLKASIEIPDHDFDNSSIWSDEKVGDFHRMIEPGNYDLIISAPGYFPKTLSSIQVNSYNEKVWLGDILLTPLTKPHIYYSYRSKDLSMVFPEETSVNVSIYNLLGAKVGEITNIEVNDEKRLISLKGFIGSGNYAILVTQQAKVIETLLIFHP